MKERPCNKSLDAKQIFKLCCRKGCDEAGIHKMNILYLNKIGYFCHSHKLEMEKSGLAIA